MPTMEELYRRSRLISKVIHNLLIASQHLSCLSRRALSEHIVRQTYIYIITDGTFNCQSTICICVEYKLTFKLMKSFANVEGVNSTNVLGGKLTRHNLHRWSIQSELLFGK